MPYVNVPNDLSKIKTKIAFNLTKRQLICFGIGAAIGVPTYLLTRQAIGNTGALFTMGECQGKAPEPVPVVEPEPEPEPEQPKSSGGTLLLVLAMAVIGGGAGWYFKIYRPKKQQAADAAEDYGDDYDDTPPWEDEDETESEGEE